MPWCAPRGSLPGLKHHCFHCWEGWLLTAEAPGTLLLSLPSRYWHQEQHSMNFLHSNFCLRVCLLRKPMHKDVNNNKVMDYFRAHHQKFHVVFSWVSWYCSQKLAQPKAESWIQASHPPVWQPSSQLHDVLPGNGVEWMREGIIRMCEQ